MKKSPLRKLSGKRRKQVNEYIKARRKYLAEHLVCQICNEEEATQIHHKNGRTNERLNDQSHWLGVCQACHTYCHTNPEAAMKAGWLLQRKDNL